jgi:hypothetical protein
LRTRRHFPGRAAPGGLGQPHRAAREREYEHHGRQGGQPGEPQAAVNGAPVLL